MPPKKAVSYQLFRGSPWGLRHTGRTVFSLEFTWRYCVLLACIMTGLAVVAKADTHYVSLSAVPDAPYTNWATAANSIQAAVNSTENGDEVVVADGIYYLAAQITITNGITVRSDLGRTMCRIDGSNLCRCIWLAHSNAVVSGFTIARGLADENGAGIYVSQAGTVRDCSIINNTCSNALFYTMRGGGIYLAGGGTIRNCLVSGNIVESAGTEGGGIYMSGGLVENCIVISNMSRRATGGLGAGIHLDKGIVNHCTIVKNSGVYRGGGVFLDNDAAIVVNSIVCNNQSTGYQDCRINRGSVSFTYCTWYDPMSYDVGNVYVQNQPDPRFVDYTNSDFHLQMGSPCIDAGATTDVVAVDYDYKNRPLDGNVDGNFRVDMGAFEFDYAGLRCGLGVDKSQGFDPLPVRIECFTDGSNLNGLYYWWDFDNDGYPDLAGSNLAVVTNIYTNWGWKTVSVTVSNAAGEIASAALTNAFKVGRPLVYISPSGLGPFPYASWAMAATNLNMITDLLVDGSEVVVTNGHYDLSQEFLLDFAVTLRSVSGWRQTTLDGNDITRCVRLTHSGAVVEGFTLTRGYGSPAGAGAYIYGGGTVRNCWINNNHVYSGAISRGGGVAIFESGLLANCLVTDNTTVSSPVNEALARGGGVSLSSGGIIENCTITGNSAPAQGQGGGVYGENISGVTGGGTIYNCIVWGNSGSASPNIGRKNNATGVAFTCAPDPISSMGGNITNDPCLSADWHLQAGSPCVDAGTNQPGGSGMSGALDLDGLPRIDNGFVDMGCYEYIAPVITTRPQSARNTLGAPASFTVGASGTAPLYYQWQKDTTNIVTATNAGYTIAAVTNSDAGLYRCIVSNVLNTVTSAAALLTVSEPVTATHAGPGYVSGSVSTQTLTITNTFNFPTNRTLYSLSWSPSLPAGWILSTNTWGTNTTPQVNPTNDSNIIFTGDLPATSPIVFYYQVIVPANQSGSNSISATAQHFYIEDNNPVENTVNPNPLQMPMLLTIQATGTNKVYGASDPALGYTLSSGTLASGDSFTGALSRVAGETIGNYAITQGTLGISSSNNNSYVVTFVPANLTVTGKEITVGGTFTAANKIYDGNKTATISTNNLTLVGVLAGDTNNVTLNPVVEFASSNVGTHVVSLTAATAISGTAATNYTLSLGGAPTANATIMPPDVGTAAHDSAGYYSPSTNMLVSNTFTYASGTLTSLVWHVALPGTGDWALVAGSAAGDNSPTISGANITLSGSFTSPVKFTYRVSVPGNAVVSNSLGGSASYWFSGGGGVEQVTTIDVIPIFRYHSADYQTPFRAIKTVEVNRVLILWRAGNYQPSSTPGDGYEAAATPYMGPDTGRHSADYQTPFWQIKTVEMNRVLMMWRSTGYHVDLAQDDGYMAGMAGPGPSTNGP